MANDYPTGAFVLLLIGGILELAYAALPGMMAGMIGLGGFLGGAMLFAVCAGWFILWAILTILAAIWAKSGDQDKVHKAGILGIVAFILGGFNILTLIGAILALIWKKKTAPVAAPPPPPPA